MLKDLLFTLRMLGARPAFALAAVATLAVGVGASTAIFSTVNAALLRPLPYRAPDDLYTLGTTSTDGGFSTGLVAPAELTALNSSAPSIVKAAIVRRVDTTIAAAPDQDLTRPHDEGPVQIIAYGVSEGFFDLFGLPLTLGTGFTAEHHTPFVLRFSPDGRRPVLPQQAAVLSHRVWQNQFGRDPNIVGRSVRFSYGQAIVVGVASPDFDVPAGADVWTNMRAQPQSVSHGYNGYLRARPGTTPDRLAAELGAVMAGVARQFPANATGLAFVTRPLVDSIVGDLGPTLVLVLAGATLLLLLACANVTNLLLTRSAVRSREIALRTALGASRGRILRQLLTESLVLAAAGAAGGLLIAFVGVRVLLVLGASTLPRLQSVPFDGRVLAFALVTLIAATVAVSILPAVRLLAAPSAESLNGRHANAGGRATLNFFSAMIVAEIVVAITLVAGAGWLVRSFANLSAADPGFTVRGRIVFDVFLPGRYAQPEALATWRSSLDERLRAIGSVTAVGTTSVVPFRPERDVAYYIGTQHEADAPGRQLTARLRSAGPGFFQAMGITVVDGREFTKEDRETPRAIVNRAFAQRYLHGESPVNAQFYFGFPTVDRTAPYTIVGVVENVKYASIGEPAEPVFYTPDAELQETFVVASSLADPRPILASVQSAVKSLDPTIRVNPLAMPHIVAASLSRQRLGVLLMMLFGAGALALAAIGIYGVVAYVSAERAREIATRLALGGTPSDVIWMLTNHGLTLAAIGTGLGLLAAYLVGRILSNRLYEVRAFDSLILVSAVVAVLAITVTAIVVPARRVSKINVAATLRLQ